MLFLRGFAHHLAIVLMIRHVYGFDIVATEDCEAAFRQVLVKRERGRRCVYVYQQGGERFIGWRFSLHHGQQAIAAAFERLGVDFEQFRTSPATPSDESCECSRVPCLNKRQTKKLLNISVDRTLQRILALVPSFTNLCCSLQSRIFILTFTSGGRIFSDFASSDIEYHIKMQSWRDLSQRLNQTEWCRLTTNQELCAEQTRPAIADGCGGVHDGSRDRRGIDGDSKENATCAENTCGIGSTVFVAPSTTRELQVDIRSTATNSLILVKSSTPAPKNRIQSSRRIPSVGTTFVTPTNAGYSNRDSQLAPAEPSSHIQISGMRKNHPLISKHSPLFTIGFLTPTVSSAATKSLEQDAATLRLSLLASTTRNGQDYVYKSSTGSAEISLNHGLTTQPTSAEYREGKSSAAWSFSLTPSLKFVTETTKAPSVASSPSETESVSLRRLSFETSSLSQVLQTNTSIKVAKLASPTTPVVHKDWSSSLTQSVTAEKAKSASVIQNNPPKMTRTWSSSSLEAELSVSLKSSWQEQQTSFRRQSSSILNAVMTSSPLGRLTESIFSAASTSETPADAELPLVTPLSQVLHTKTSLKSAELFLPATTKQWSRFQLTPSVKFEGEKTKSSSVTLTDDALKISRKRWSTPLSVEKHVPFTSSWPLQQTSRLYRTSSVLETGMPSSSLGPKLILSATSASKTTIHPDLSFETSSASSTAYNVPAGFSRESFPSQVLQSSMSLRFAVLNSSTTTALIHHKLDLSSTITSTPSLNLKTLLSKLSSISGTSKSWFAHVQQKSEQIGTLRHTWFSEISVTQISIRPPAYVTASPASVSASRVLVNYRSPSEIPAAQSFSSATQNTSSKLTVPIDDLHSVILDTTRSSRNSSGTMHDLLSIRISQTLSKTIQRNSSTSRPVNPWRSYKPTIRCQSSRLHSSVRALFPAEQTVPRIHLTSQLSSTNVGVSSLLFLHTDSAAFSRTDILDVKITKQIQSIAPLTTSQTGHHDSDMRTMEALSRIRTSDVITWSSSLSAPSPSTTPLHPPPSPTTTAQTNVSTASLDADKTLANSLSVSVIESPLPFTPSFSSWANKANSATFSAVSTKTRRIRGMNSTAISSSLRSTLVLRLKTSLQRKASASADHSTDPTWAKTPASTVALTQQLAEKQSGTPLPSSHDLVSAVSVIPARSSVVPFSKSSSAHTTLLPASVARTTIISPSFASSELSAAVSSVLGFSQYDQTYLVVFSGNCTMLDNKDDFTEQFKAVLTQLLAIRAADISVLKISCGSVHVLFSISEAKRRNITNKLRRIVEDKAFKFEYNNVTFVALDVSEYSPSPGTTARPSRTTQASRTAEVKQIAFIVFIFIVSVFAALTVFLAAVFCARFCRCCQRRQKPKQTPADVELKVFSSLYLNLFRKVDYYGGSSQATPAPDEEQPVSTVTALLSEHRKVADLEEKQLNFDDTDSCSSVLFY